MLRNTILIAALVLSPVVASAQPPCTSDAARVVDEIFRHMLERSADSAGGRLIDRLQSGQATVRDIVRDVAMSPEHPRRFYNRSENDAELRAVESLYRHVLGRGADDQGARDHANMLRNQGINAVVDSLIGSAEYQQQFGDWGVPGSGGLRYCGPDRFVGALGGRPRSDRYGQGNQLNEPGIVLFAQPRFRGSSSTIEGPRRANPRVNSQVRSVQVTGGTWQLCEQAQFRGRCVTVSSDVSDTRDIGLGNYVGSVRQTTRY
jgi:hypothetical protein